jgi:hypothetical protein
MEELSKQDEYDKQASEEKRRINKLQKRLSDFKTNFNTTKQMPIFSGIIKCAYSGRETKDHKPEGKYDAKPEINVKIYGDIFSVDGDFYIQGADTGNYTYEKDSYGGRLGTISFKDGKNYASYYLEQPQREEEQVSSFEIINGEAYLPEKLKSTSSSYEAEEYLSTSSLGREIGIIPKEFIEYMIGQGLLKRVNKILTLTDLGKQYGGTHNSKGNEVWIVWPKSILDKPIITNYGKSNLPQNPKIDPSLEDKISYFGLYHPYNQGNNPEFDRFSGRVLDLKSNKDGAVDYFFEQLKNVDFNGTEAIVIVPSHTPQNKMSTVKKLAQKLAKYKGWIDASDCAVRTHEIAKLASGGDRSLNTHLGSLKIMHQHLITGKNVLVLDDVTTSGNSLFATMKLLKDNNVNSTWSYAIAKTN